MAQQNYKYANIASAVSRTKWIWY